MEPNQAPLNIFKEEIIESEENTVSLNVYVKQELYEDDHSVNVIGDLIGETKGLSSIKQEENIDLKTDIILEESNGSIKLESNSIDNSENKLNYSNEKRRIPELEDTTDEVQSNIYPQKRLKKGHLDIRTKEMVLDVYKHEISENPTMVIHDVERSVAAQTGVCPKTVFNIMKEYKQNNKFSAPKRKLRYKQICDTVEDYHKKAIRYKVYEFFFRNELPSIDKVLKDVNDDPLLPSFKRGTFYKLLKILNFRFKTRGKMSLLLDRDEIVLWRRKYLQDIKRYRREDRKIYYLDGTWIDAGRSLNGKHIKARDHLNGVIICPICGNLYTNQVGYFLHFSTDHSLKKKKLFKTQFNRRDTGNLINLNKDVEDNIKMIKDETKEKLKKTRKYVRTNDTDNHKLYSGEMVRNSLLHCKKQFKCNICLKSISLKSYLINHIRCHTGEKPYKCDYCLKSFTQKGTLNTHLRYHTGEKLFKCEVCLKHFPVKNKLDTHMRCHTGEKPYKCHICLKSFTQKGTLNTHLRYHTGEKLFKCEVCLKHFSVKNKLDTHMRCHTGEKPFKCDICSKSFSQKGDLNRHSFEHSFYHTDEKTFKCEICLKGFSRKNVLSKHYLCHSGEKPFKCDICLKSFTLSYNLKTHLRCHTEEKPFQCDICLKDFSLKSGLTKHLRFHTGKNPFKCDICLKYFTRKSTLNRHLLCHAGEIH